MSLICSNAVMFHVSITYLNFRLRDTPLVLSCASTMHLGIARLNTTMFPQTSKSFDLRKQITEAVESVGDQQKKASLSKSLKQIGSNHEE